MEELNCKLDVIDKLMKQCEDSKLISFAYQDAIFSISFSKAEADAGHSTNIIRKFIMENAPELKKCNMENGLDELSISDISLADQVEAGDIVTIKSPFVGTIEFIDQLKLKDSVIHVNKGDVICSVEAMKIYNDIKAPCSGAITELLVKDCSLVEYDQPLLTIRVDKNE